MCVFEIYNSKQHINYTLIQQVTSFYDCTIKQICDSIRNYNVYINVIYGEKHFFHFGVYTFIYCKINLYIMFFVRKMLLVRVYSLFCEGFFGIIIFLLCILLPSFIHILYSQNYQTRVNYLSHQTVDDSHLLFGKRFKTVYYLIFMRTFDSSYLQVLEFYMLKDPIMINRFECDIYKHVIFLQSDVNVERQQNIYFHAVEIITKIIT